MSSVYPQQHGDEEFSSITENIELAGAQDHVRLLLLVSSLHESAAQLGQDDWFKAQTKDGKRNRVPYSSRSPVTLTLDGQTVGKEGHQGLMSYETMKTIAHSPDTVTREALKEMLTKDFQAVGYNLDFSYLDSITEEQFKAWMQDVATKRIHDNDAWGKTATGFLEAQGINILKLKSGELTVEQVQMIFDLKKGINSIWNPKTTSEFRTLLQNNVALKVAMVTAHSNWRKSKYTQDENYQNFSIENSINEAKSALTRADIELEAIESQINSVREGAHKSPTISPEISFELMLKLCDMLEEVASKHEDVITRARILNQRDKLLDTIRYDANTAITDSVIQMGNLKDQTES